jgi:predicted Zn finger-like uncharacterized protein
MPLQTRCPACGNSLQVPDAAVGKRVRCPTCRHVWAIPRPTPEPTPITTCCPTCKKSLQVPGEAVGKKAKCPACEHVWTISRPGQVTTEQPKSWFDEALDEASRVQAANAATPKPDSREAVKLWRDGKYLVVDIRASQFPAYCVKTGLPTTNTHRIELAWVERSKTWGVSLWSIFGPAGKLATMRLIEKMKTKFSLRVGLSPNWLATRRIKRLVAWAVIGIGIAVALSGGWTVRYVPAPGRQPVTVSLAMIAGVVIAAVGSFSLDLTSNRSVLGVQTMDGNYAWIVGVHRDFLDRMEPWKG